MDQAPFFLFNKIAESKSSPSEGKDTSEATRKQITYQNQPKTGYRRAMPKKGFRNKIYLPYATQSIIIVCR